MNSGFANMFYPLYRYVNMFLFSNVENDVCQYKKKLNVFNIWTKSFNIYRDLENIKVFIDYTYSRI